MASLFAFIHHLAAFVLFAALVMEFVLIKGETASSSAVEGERAVNALTLANARKLLRADMIFGIASGVLLLAGMVRVFYLEKGAEYYFHSAPFIAKLALFVVVGLLSIYPTLKFLSWRKDVKAGRAPVPGAPTLRRIKLVLHIEMTGVVLIILFAALMARGVGSYG